MPPNAITDAETAVGQPLSQPLMRKIKDWVEFFFGQSSSVVDFPNNNFEIDSDANGQPDLWTVATHAGGTVELDTTTPIEGSSSLKMIHPGGGSQGGGTALSDFIPVSPDSVNNFSFLLKSTAAGVKINVTVKYYDKDKTTINEDSVIYTSTANPTSATEIIITDTAPGTALFCAIELEGGDTDTDVAATMHFDIVKFNGLTSYAYTVGSYVITDAYHDDATGNTTSPQKTLQAKMGRGGTVRVRYGQIDLVTGGSGSVVVRVYKNGAAQGSAQVSASASWVFYTLDLAVDIGDLVQIYAWGETGNRNSNQKLQICVDTPLNAGYDYTFNSSFDAK